MFKPKKLSSTERREAAHNEIKRILAKYRCTLDATVVAGPLVPNGSIREVVVIALDDETEKP